MNNYEKENEKINTLNKLIYSENSIEEKLMKYELINEDLQLKQKLKEEEKKYCLI